MKKLFLFTVFLSWTATGFCEITGVTTQPGSTNGTIQYNKRGVFGGDTSFTYSTATQRITVPSAYVSSLTAISVGLSTFTNTPSLPFGIRINGNVYNSVAGTDSASSSFYAVDHVYTGHDYFREVSISSALHLPDGYIQKYRVFYNIKDSTVSVVNGIGVNDDTAAFQHAINNLPAGGILYIPSGTYKITSTITIQNVNRITIMGEGLESNINYTPGGVDNRMFLIDGSVDNITFKSFGVTQTNPTTRTGCSAFVIGAGATRLFWDNMFISAFSRYGLNFAAGTYYIDIRNHCRFIRIRDTTSTYNAKAINSSGSNSFTVQDTQFSENDKNIQIDAGTNIRIVHNEMEVDGNSGNALIDYTNQLTGINNLEWIGNYQEAEIQYTTYAFLNLINCVAPVIRSNLFNGQESVTQKTQTFIEISGANTVAPIIDYNYFTEPGEFLVRSSVPFQMGPNKYVDSGVTLSSHAAIMALISDPSMADIPFISTMSWNPSALVDGAGETSPTFTVAGSSVIDRVDVYPPYNLNGLLYSAYVSTSGVAVVRLQNETGVPVDLSTGTWGVRIRKSYFP